MDKIILIGTGGHARSCMDVIESTGFYQIAGLVEKVGLQTEENLGYSVIGTDDDLPKLYEKYKNALITVGQIKSATNRVNLFQLLSKLNYQFPVIVSPRAYISPHCKIGAGTIIMHDAVVNMNAKIGENCIINSKALIEHDAVIGDHCHISTGAIVNGNTKIGKESFFGSGAVAKQSIFIGEKCLIGAGAIINNNIEANQVIKN